MGPDRLALDNLADRHTGLTPEIAACFLQAVRVCLDRHHTPPTEFSVENGDQRRAVSVVWEPPNTREKGAWANENEATEKGACPMVLAALEFTAGLVAVGRAETGTGADYYVGQPGTTYDDLEQCFRLEVSGIDRGTDRMVRARLLEKVGQTERGRSNLPAIAGVVGFLAKLITLRFVEGK